MVGHDVGYAGTISSKPQPFVVKEVLHQTPKSSSLGLPDFINNPF